MGKKKSDNGGKPAEVALAEKPEKRGKKSENGSARADPDSRLSKNFYESESERLYLELVKLQHWIALKGLRVILIFEGRDAAGKGGLIKRITEPLNPRGVRLVALSKPSDVERTQWYFQRYVAHLPAAGEIVIFDRSWYNRSGVERVMGFCSDAEYWEFLQSCPEFERMLVRSGIILLKYYLSVSDTEQERRFQSRAKDPTRRWKLSDMDLETRMRWVEYSKAKDIMLEHTDIPEARWFQIEADDKLKARLNCMRHLLEQIPYEDVIPKPIKLQPRPPDDQHYVRPPRDKHIVIRDYYADVD
ncbi:MAG: polyphosphate kinase 2 [Anaerolineae bacterium]|nr:polyphosphate kinase 2 [Anaerolineae bacterium]